MSSFSANPFFTKLIPTLNDLLKYLNQRMNRIFVTCIYFSKINYDIVGHKGSQLNQVLGQIF
jgi:hypothetical protein